MLSGKIKIKKWWKIQILLYVLFHSIWYCLVAQWLKQLFPDPDIPGGRVHQGGTLGGFSSFFHYLNRDIYSYNADM